MRPRYFLSCNLKWQKEEQDCGRQQECSSKINPCKLAPFLHIPCPRCGLLGNKEVCWYDRKKCKGTLSKERPRGYQIRSNISAIKKGIPSPSNCVCQVPTNWPTKWTASCSYNIHIASPGPNISRGYQIFLDVSDNSHHMRYVHSPVIKIFTKESIPAPPIPETIRPATTISKDWPKALHFNLVLPLVW